MATEPAGTGVHDTLSRKHHPGSFKFDNDAVVEPYAPACGIRSSVDGRLEVRLRITLFAVRDVDLVSQTFIAKFFLEVSWLDAALATELQGKSLEVDEAESDWQRGTLVMKGDKEHYYFAPKVKFENMVRYLL